jgi:UPF0755 protein
LRIPRFDIKKVKTQDIYLPAVLFIIVLIVLTFTFYSGNDFENNSSVYLSINKGANLSEVTDSLYALNVIPNKTNFRIAAFLYGAEKNIKAGRYTIPSGLNYFELIELLTNPKGSDEVLVTIPEGIWQNELAQILKKELGIDSAQVIKLSGDRKFISSLNLTEKNIEGYLLPETYYFYSNSTGEEVLRKLKNEMDRFLAKETEQIKLSGMTIKEILTLASIIDGESNLISEFKRISGVYHNRLKKGMVLQADPTVQYLIREKRNNRILYKDLQIDSRYNTYKYAGLPPSPINNPGKDAIIAALYPEKHNYLYFVADGKGGHVFARSFNEHENNVARYRVWRRNQR